MRSPTALGYLLALGAATAYGINAVVIREGTQRFGIVLPGLVIALLVGLASMAPLAWRARPPASSVTRRSLVLVALAGACAAVGIGSHTLALSQMPVSIVTPISSTYPLVTILLVRLFLRHTERITPRIVLGALCVVAGVVVIALNRATAP
jgi:drug/metabolite transporter, DME family